MTPDCTGIYEYAGQFNGKAYYRRLTGGYFIWWHVTDDMLISTAPGDVTPGVWDKPDSVIPGNYDPGPGTMGIATVTEY